MLAINNITKSFKKNKVLKDVSFRIYDNEIVGFLGPNGAGKTTLLKIISRLILPDTGNILLNHRKITMDKISTMFDGTRNLYWLEKNKNFFQIDGLLEKKFGELSLGQKQIVAVITTLLITPELLCLDEPSNGLDIYYEKKLIDIIVDYSKNLRNKIIISSHDIDFLYKTVDRFIVINNGEILGEFFKKNLTLENITTKYLKLLEGEKWKNILML